MVLGPRLLLVSVGTHIPVPYTHTQAQTHRHIPIEIYTHTHLNSELKSIIKTELVGGHDSVQIYVIYMIMCSVLGICRFSQIINEQE